MTIAVSLFARARELAGTSKLELLLPDKATVSLIRAAVREKVPDLTSLLETSAIAVNQNFASDEQTVLPGDEVAIIPPVSGG